MNNKVKFLRGTATEYEASTKDNDTFYYTTDDEKLYLGNKEITGGGVTIDDTLSDTSKNPVQNKVINAALNSKANLSDIPASLPANGGNADTSKAVQSATGKALLHENEEGGNLKLFSPDGTKALEIDLFNNECMRFILLEDNNTIVPLIYDFSTKKFNINGNADSVDGIHITTADDGHTYDWLACFTSTNEIRAINPDRAYVKNAGNADTVDGKHASDFASTDDNYWLYTFSEAGSKHGAAHRLVAKYNVKNDGRFYIQDEDTHQVRVNYADGADTANTAGTLSATVSNVCLRNISAGTEDLSAGVSELATGAIYLVYE